MNIAVLTIGDELLSGELADSNTQRIARQLSPHGYGLRESLSVGDDRGDIEEALATLAARMDVVIVTGGLGPTVDDLTAAAAAHVFGLPLERNDEALSLIRQYFARLGVDMHPRNDKQAMLPRGAALIPNPKGSAPGFSLTRHDAFLFFLPGVPAEMTTMLDESVLPALRQRQGGQPPRQEKLFQVFGLSEPRVEELLSRNTLPDGVQLAFGVDFPLVIVKLRSARPDAAELLTRGESQVRQVLGDFVVAAGGQTLAENVARQLTDSGSTLALAESCTGGLISTWLTNLPGASAFLERSAVTYANSAKQDWLQVPEQVLSEQGAVSEACALAMAAGIRGAAGTRLGVAVTGIAGPEGGTAQKPVGTVFIALSAADREEARGYRFHGNREQVRILAACMALDWIRRYLLTRPAAELTAPEEPR